MKYPQDYNFKTAPNLHTSKKEEYLCKRKSVSKISSLLDILWGIEK